MTSDVYSRVVVKNRVHVLSTDRPFDWYFRHGSQKILCSSWDSYSLASTSIEYHFKYEYKNRKVKAIFQFGRPIWIDLTDMSLCLLHLIMIRIRWLYALGWQSQYSAFPVKQQVAHLSLPVFKYSKMRIGYIRIPLLSEFCKQVADWSVQKVIRLWLFIGVS